jgi:entericidin A
MPGRITMKKLLVVLVSGLVLCGCNTFQGVGKDVKKVGEVVENAARR